MSFETGELIWLVGENIPLVTELVPFGDTSWLGANPVLEDLVILLAIGSTESEVFWDCSTGDPGSVVFCSVICLLKLPCKLAVIALMHSPSGDIRCIMVYTEIE